MMKNYPVGKIALRLGLVAVLVGFGSSFGQTQDPAAPPTYGTLNLEAGFEPDPAVVKVDAGGNINTKLGGFSHWVAKEPDVRVNYKAGKYDLTFYVECDKDATLLINMPDGKTWVANDDGPGTGLNPLIKLKNPPSGQYDIWVGTLGNIGTPPAKLFITELK